MLDVAIVRTLREVDALQPEWDDLETQTPEATGFQSFTWCRQWLALAGEHGRRNIQPLVVTVRIASRLVMLCPLQHVSVAGLRVARWIGEPLTQYGDVLAEPGPGRPAWQDAAEAAIRETRDIDLILFKHVRSDGVFKVRTRQDTGRHQVVGIQIVGHETIGPDAAAPFIDLAAPSTPTILASHHRRLRRRQRRLASRGIIGIDTDLQPALRVEAVRTAFAFKHAWLKHKGLFSRGLSHRLSAMFLERLARDGHLATSVLRVGAETAAVELGLHRGAAYRSLLSAFDLRFAEGAPGHILTTHLVTRVRDRGFRYFDFLAPCDDYKLKWASDRVVLRSTALPMTQRGRLLLAAVRLRPLVKRAAMAVAGWRRRLTVSPRFGAPRGDLQVAAVIPGRREPHPVYAADAGRVDAPRFRIFAPLRAD